MSSFRTPGRPLEDLWLEAVEDPPGREAGVHWCYDRYKLLTGRWAERRRMPLAPPNRRIALETIGEHLDGCPTPRLDRFQSRLIVVLLNSPGIGWPGQTYHLSAFLEIAPTIQYLEPHERLKFDQYLEYAQGIWNRLDVYEHPNRVRADCMQMTEVELERRLRRLVGDIGIDSPVAEVSDFRTPLAENPSSES